MLHRPFYFCFGREALYGPPGAEGDKPPPYGGLRGRNAPAIHPHLSQRIGWAFQPSERVYFTSIILLVSVKSPAVNL
jgi:hypothetical protein